MQRRFTRRRRLTASHVRTHDDAGALPHATGAGQREVLPGRGRPDAGSRSTSGRFSVVLLLIVVGTVGTYMLRRVATDQAIRDARALTAVVWRRACIKPELTRRCSPATRQAAARASTGSCGTRALVDADRAREGLDGRPAQVVYSDERAPDRPDVPRSPRTRCEALDDNDGQGRACRT